MHEDLTLISNEFEPIRGLGASTVNGLPFLNAICFIAFEILNIYNKHSLSDRVVNIFCLTDFSILN